MDNYSKWLAQNCEKCLVELENSMLKMHSARLAENKDCSDKAIALCKYDNSLHAVKQSHQGLFSHACILHALSFFLQWKLL